MLPYATEQQIVKIVNEKLREQGEVTPSKDEIVSIVNDAIESGEINVSAFEEVEVKLYYSDLSFDSETNQISITNATKKQQLYDICQQVVEENKIIYGTFAFPTLDDSFASLDKEKCNIIINGLLSYVINENSGAFVTIEKAYGGTLLSNGFVPVKYGDDTIDVYCVYINYDIDYLQAGLQTLALDTNKYISLKFRIEK